MASRGARCTLSRGARLLRSAGVQQAHPCPFVGSTHVAPPLTHSSGSSSGVRNPDELIMLIRGHKKTAALSGPERVSGIESPREALRLGIAARAPEQREHSGVLIANEQSAVVQARAAECSGMARVGAARASAQRCAHAAAALATSHGQRQPERGHSSCLFQRGTLGGRPVGWGEETTVVRRHSPEHGFLRVVVELALELAHREVRWSRGRWHGVMCVFTRPFLLAEGFAFWERIVFLLERFTSRSSEQVRNLMRQRPYLAVRWRKGNGRRAVWSRAARR